MKHLKMLGLLVVAAASLMAFAASAYATPVLTSPEGVEYTGPLHATLTGTAKLEAGLNDTCTESTVFGDITTNNETHAKGPITAVSFGKCTTTTNVLSPEGELTIADNGQVTLTGVRVTVSQFGISCVYGGGTGTNLGSLTPGKTAVLNAETHELPKQEGSAFCASKGTWTANYTVTTPDALFIT